jgi:hypothetical protein
MAIGIAGRIFRAVPMVSPRIGLGSPERKPKRLPRRPFWGRSGQFRDLA